VVRNKNVTPKEEQEKWYRKRERVLIRVVKRMEVDGWKRTGA